MMQKRKSGKVAGRAARALAGLGLALIVSVGGSLARADVTSEDEPQAISESGASMEESVPALTPEAPSLPEVTTNVASSTAQATNEHDAHAPVDYWSLLLVLVLATFIGIGVIGRVSRLLHTPLMSLTNAISAIAVVGSIVVTGADYPLEIRMFGAVALFASMTNIVSGFLITDRMLRMFKQKRGGAKQ